MGAAENERPVRKDGRCAVAELVSADAVGLHIVDEAVHRAVVFSEAGHGGYPEVALKVFLHGTDIQAGCALNGMHPLALGFKQEPVADGPQPDIACAVPEKFVRNEDRTFDTGRVVFGSDGILFAFLRISIYHQRRFVEAAHQQFPGLG